MQYRALGKTDLQVSMICLGTMTWGEQNTLEEAHSQLDYAFDHGVNFIDTAEMYPVPPKAETYTRTEEIIGQWSKLQTQRDKVILATKVVGPSEFMTWVRDGQPRLNRDHIRSAIDASLKRLKTDYVDLYQLHWPDRSTNFFGQLGFKTKEDEEMTNIEETLDVLSEIYKAGKVRHFGLSNETPWGAMTFLQKAKEKDAPRMVSIQNPYNLLNRTYEIGLAEVSCRESIGLLAYSPLGFGALTGKYLNGKKPAGARLTLWERFGRYTNPRGIQATEKYVQLAKSHGLSPAQMALSYVNSRPFVTSNIIGATSLDQLKENIASVSLELSPEVVDGIENIHNEISNPCP